MLPTRGGRSDWMAFLLGDSDRTWITILLRAGFLIGVLGVAAWVIYFACATIAWPYPIEYREGASQVMTQFLLEGRNPFSLENQPLGMNNYGIAYSLLVLPLAGIFGNTLLIHRAVSFAFVVLSAWLVFQTARRSNKDVGLALAAGEFLAVGLVARAGLGAFPHSLGTFLFLAGILIPLSCDFDRRGLLLSAVLCLLAFYTKPYFLLAFGMVAGYVFLFKSKQKALLYALAFTAMFLASFLLVRSVFPLYFLDTVLSNFSQTAGNSAEHLYRQLRELGTEFYLSLLTALVVTLANMRNLRPGLVWLKDLTSKANFLILNHPLLSRPLNYFAYCFLCGCLVFILVLGPNPESYMSYSYQLMLAPFFLWLAGELKPQRRLDLILLCVLLINLVLFCWTQANPDVLQQVARSEQTWRELYARVDPSGRILNSPLLVSELLRRGMLPVDSGHTEYYYAIREVPGIDALGPPYEIVRDNGQRYLESVRASIRNQEFARIIVTDPGDFFYDNRNRNLVGRYYQQTAAFSLQMPQASQKWQLVIWEPIQSSAMK